MSNPSLSGTTSSAQSTTSPIAAEPGPDWPVAKKLWGIAWEFHWAGLGTLFSILAVRSFLVLAQVRTRQRFGRKPLFIAINSLLFTLGTTRALFLFLDPYSSAENGIEIPPWISMLVFGITYPCLTSSFCLIHLAFLEVVKIQLGSKRLQDVRFLGGVITAHFALVITAETSAALRPKLTPLLIICQSFFILWGFVLSTSFIYSGLKVIRYDNRVQKQLMSIELGERASRRGMEKSNKGISKVAKVTLATSVLGFVCCGMQIYSVFGVYGLYSKAVNPSPWPWWVYQTCFRLVEFFMACTIAYSVTQSAD